MSHGFHIPADARARSKMLAAHLEEAARKIQDRQQQCWQAKHLKVPPANAKRGGRPKAS
jgi:hypothetical protein